jgi:hypothetical protein
LVRSTYAWMHGSDRHIRSQLPVPEFKLAQLGATESYSVRRATQLESISVEWGLRKRSLATQFSCRGHRGGHRWTRKLVGA